MPWIRLKKKTEDLTCQNSLKIKDKEFHNREKMSQKKEETKADYVILDPPEDTLIKDTTMKEKFHVFEISKRISKYLSGLLFATGAMSILLSAQYFFGAKLLLASELKTLFLIALGFTGAVNLISGLLLLSKE